MITRKTLHDKLITVLPVHWVGQPEGICKKPYIVAKYKSQTKSVSNDRAGWQYLDIMVYVPKTSVLALDGYIAQVQTALKDITEPTGNITPDYLDQQVEAIMRSIEFRMPKEVV